MRYLINFLLPILLISCQNGAKTKEEIKPQTGIWRGVIALNDSVDLSFNFQLDRKDDGTVGINIFNASEEINTTVSLLSEDSLKIEMPVFANYIVAKFDGNTMKGEYINPDGENYHLPFTASFGDTFRFENTAQKCCSINKKWAVKFGDESTGYSPAIAYFEQTGNKVTGTFTTETGDYRYLEGVLTGTMLQLSTFDGAHLYYFEGEVKNGDAINGLYYSGRSSVEPWMAYRDDNFELRNADSLTYLKDGYYGVDFSFENLGGQMVSLKDPRYDGKPVIIQIMGSWCPNCMDETRYLNGIYDTYHSEGLEIIGLTFERTKGKEEAIARASKMVHDLSIEYAVLLAGYTRNDKASDALPMLNRIMSYPTSIYLNADHSVRKIHTGFNGPGTPLYEDFVTKDRLVIEEILRSQPGE